MPIVKKDEQFPERSIVVMLVGTPFSRKTSLANTAKNAVLIDADRGADRSWGRPDTFVLKNGWAELLQEDQAGTFNEYSTIIHDTSKAILDDFLMEYVISNNYKLKTNKMQMYGAIGDEYKQYVNKHRGANQDIIIISHDKTKDEDGANVIMPDITGGSKNLLLRICDQVGYVSNKRIQKEGKWVDIVTVDFTPTQMTPFCKNVAGLPEIELPHYSTPEWKNFMDTHIMQPTKDAISKMTEDQRQALEILADWQTAIDAIADDGRDVSAELIAINTGEDGFTTKVPQEHLQKQIRAYWVKHFGALGYEWKGKLKAFVKIGATTPEPVKEAEKPAETPPVEDTNRKAQLMAEADEEFDRIPESQSEPEIDLVADAEQQRAELQTPRPENVVKNPHTAPVKEDLFGARSN